MSEKIKDGGPAFPAPWHPEMGWSPRESPPGMSLRDYFAAACLAECLAEIIRLSGDDTGWSIDTAAYHSYLMADAMLKAREAKP